MNKTITEKKNIEYGVADTSYQVVGGLVGIKKLVDDFYLHMDNLPKAKGIRDMHSSNLVESKLKLSYFLSGWLGGPKLYEEHFGGINIPLAHQHISVGFVEMEAWLLCIQRAIDRQNYEPTFKVYLLAQLRIPAERIRKVSQHD